MLRFSNIMIPKTLWPRFRFLRQQRPSSKNGLCLSLADFIAPSDQKAGVSKACDYMGAFVVSTGKEVEEYAQYFEKSQDDYTSIIVKALGDRIAEAAAEMIHHKVRLAWGHEPENSQGFNIQDLVKENYRGIRPAPGYPACPDHTEKNLIWDLLDVEKSIGVKLTESFAMTPGSSVSGYYFGCPQAAYFRVGKIARDQVEDYADRKGMEISQVEKWLRPNLDYEPAD